jgi:hypothetical protein
VKYSFYVLFYVTLFGLGRLKFGVLQVRASGTYSVVIEDYRKTFRCATVAPVRELVDSLKCSRWGTRLGVVTFLTVQD